MSRYVLLAGLTLPAIFAGACASAGSETVDARPADAARMIDAPRMIDAAVDLCPTTATCMTANMIGTVSGDTSNMMVSTMGYQNAWIRVRVTEDDSDLVGVAMSATAQLISPPGVTFDITAYLNAGQDVVECATTVGTKTPNGNTVSISHLWGETGIASNGSSDSRFLTIEIRKVSGTCAPSAMWSLTVTGNT